MEAKNVLFEPLPLGGGTIVLGNRFIMPPLMRCRATPHTHMPTGRMIEYYELRARHGCGLIIAEATMVQEGASSFYAEAGIYNDDHVAGWSAVTEAVHKYSVGGQPACIFLQLMHAGRHSVPENTDPISDAVHVSSTDKLAIVGRTVMPHFTPSGKQTDLLYKPPKRLTDDEVRALVVLYAEAAKRAMRAGFDGVEIHSANGYLVDQFLSSGCNDRPSTSVYSGDTVATRAKFLFDVVDAVVEAIGDAGRVGLRLSPQNTYGGMDRRDAKEELIYVCRRLRERKDKLAYLHVMRGCFTSHPSKPHHRPSSIFCVNTVARDTLGWTTPLISNMSYTPEEAEVDINSGVIDAAAFGRPFITNPDLPERVAAGVPLAPYEDNSKFYTRGNDGYLGYP
eukprot:Tbor_TRINITY_DN6053_c0_g1::TRINITY_DN6053_c0_g1_i3::g.10241::m.10241/K10680/nemA; N-ethylmaleimide reductase